MTFQEILALLTATFSGVRKDGLEHLARTLALQSPTEEEAKTLVGKLTDAQVNDFVKEYRRVVDKEVLDGNKTFESNLKKKFDLVEKPPKQAQMPQEERQDDPADIATLVANAIAAAVKPLEEKLQRYEAEGVAKSRLQALQTKLSACKDETFKAQALRDFSRMTFESDEAFDEYLTDKEGDIKSVNQSVADRSLGGGSWRPHRPLSGSEGAEATASELDAVVDRLPI